MRERPMNVARTIAVMVLVAGAAYWLGVKTRPQPAQPECSNGCKDFDETKRKLQAISETEYKEYLQLPMDL